MTFIILIMLTICLIKVDLFFNTSQTGDTIHLNKCEHTLFMLEPIFFIIIYTAGGVNIILGKQ